VATGVGGITESDANLAVTSNAIILGFNVRADAAARRVVEEKGLDLRYYSVIYELIDDVKKALSGLLSPEVTEEIIGLAEVRDVFRSSKFGAIAGCMVVEGSSSATTRSGCCATTWWSTRACWSPCAASRTMSPRSRPAPSAASA
jgi:translation initiation factor IF-2